MWEKVWEKVWASVAFDGKYMLWPSVTVSKQMVNKNSKKRLQQPGIEPVTLRSIPSGFVWSVPHSAATNPAECTCINATKLHLYMTACILCL